MTSKMTALSLGALTGLGLVALALAAAPAPQASVVDNPVAARIRPSDLPFQPPPTEHWLGEGAEERNKKARKDWFKELHRTPPDVDWKAQERDNGLAQIAKRNAIAEGLLDGTAAAGVEGRWVERGSNNQAGRMHVALHDSSRTWLYAGSSRGGLWRRPLDGGAWEPFGDNLYGGAHHMVVWSSDDGGSDIVLAATDSGLIHRTEDDGATWTVPTGLGTTHQVRRLVQSSDGRGVVWAVTGRWQGGGYDYQLVRSTDQGRTFEVLRDLDDYVGDIWVPRDGGSALYLVEDDTVLRSDDDGDSFVALGSPEGSWDQAELVGSEAGAPTLYLMTANGSGRRLHRSDDAGASWTQLLTVSDYWGTLNASQQDPSLFAWGGVEVHFTRNGGTSFDIVNPWGAYYADPANRLHADNPGMDVVVEDGQEIWYFSTDGGLYESRDGLRTVQNLSLDGLRVSQYYDVLTSSANPDHVAAGAQDQGYQSTQRMASQSDQVLAFEQVLSGDYGHLTSSDGTHETVFSVYPGFMLVALGEDDATLAYVDFPPDDNYAWMPPVVADPEDPEAVFWGGRTLWRYGWNDAAGTWVPERHASSGLDLVGREYIASFTFSPVNPQRAWIATNQGRLFRSNDKGRTWTVSSSTAPTGQYFYGQALVGSSLDLDTAYVGGTGYGGLPSVLRTTDGGSTWHAWDHGLPDTLVYSLAEARDGSGRMFAGTETAAYVRRRAEGQWEDLTGADAPITTYWAVEVLPHENTARFATYGRGIWDYQLDPDNTGCIEDQDMDLDGSPCDLDCDDANPDVHPDAEEVCDGVDSNCVADLIEVDADGDGFLACEDCDDTRSDVNPGMEEIRGNDVDEDCDGEAPRGCGCTSTGAPSPLAALLLLPLVLLRRRRT